MSKCEVTGKSPRRGRKYTHRGLAKSKGGVGRKVTGKTKRWFKPNVQRIKIIDENGTVRRAWVSTKAIKSGLVTKAPKQSIVARVRAEEAEANKRRKKSVQA